MGDFTRDSPSRFVYSACMKIKLPTVEFYAWMWLAALVIRAAYSISYRFHFQDDLAPEVVQHLLPQAIIVAALLIWRKRTEKKRLEKESLWKTIWKNYERNLLFKPIVWLHKFCLHSVLLLTLIHSCYVISCTASIMTSLTLCSFRQFEMAERLYKVTPWPLDKEDITLIGTWDGMGRKDETFKVDKEISAAIENIYGSKSKQFARRKLLIGERFCRCGVRNFSKGKEQVANNHFVSALYWFEQSLTLHKQLKDRFEITKDLSNIAYCAAKLNRLEDAKSALIEADATISGVYECDGIQSVRERLDFTASLIGVKPLPNRFIDPCCWSSHGFLDATTIAILIPFFLLFVASGSLTKTAFCKFKKLWWQYLIGANRLTLKERIVCLDKLSTVYLFQNMKDQAEKASKEMLRLAESISTIPGR